MRIIDKLDLTEGTSIVGRHSVWVPDLWIKIPFQHGGRTIKYTRPNEDSTPIEDTLPHEMAILRALGEKGMAPPIDNIVYVKELISTFDGAWRSDPMGAYGYEMADAATLPVQGRFDIEEMKKLPIEGSPGAWGDIAKEGNVINGYLIDVRRSGWDMFKWKGELKPLERYAENVVTLEERLKRDCQFPKGERDKHYQGIWIGNTHFVGSRNDDRADTLGFDILPEESVLDIGCQAGAMLQRPSIGTGVRAGIDIDEDYISVAKDVARVNRQNICFRCMDVTQQFDELLEWIPKLFKGPPDHLLLLSMEKHLGEGVLWGLVDEIGAKHTYIETNAMKEGAYRLRDGVESRGGAYLGDSEDRNTRRLYRIDR